METKQPIYFATDGASRNNGKENARASWAFCFARLDVALGTFREALSLAPTAELTPGVVGGASKKAIINGSPNIEHYNGLVESAPGLPQPSNNRGELTAMLKCLQYILEHYSGEEIIIVSDSEYTIKSIDLWSRQWIRNPNKMRGKLNLDLIHVARETLDKARKKNKVSFKHIHSHKRTPEEGQLIEWYLNLLVDENCQKPLNN